MARGYYGVAIWEPKKVENLGSILRSARCFGAAFVAIIGSRYPKQRVRTDTQRADRHIPVWYFKTLEDFVSSLPRNCEIIAVEVDGTHDIRQLNHPERAVYLFGGEDRTLPELIGAQRVKFDTKYCLNLAQTATIVMFHRTL